MNKRLIKYILKILIPDKEIAIKTFILFLPLIFPYFICVGIFLNFDPKLWILNGSVISGWIQIQLGVTILSSFL